MRRPERSVLWIAGVLACGLLGPARQAAAKGESARDAGPDAAAPASAPPLTDTDEEMPAGHPDVGGGSEENPHAHAGNGKGMPGVFEPPADTETEDPSLKPGSILVELRDADEHPVAGEMVTLGILINSVAKGDSRKHLQGTTDERGRTTFSDLDTASNTAYRVSSGYQGGSFAAIPFQLGQAKSMHVVLHVYPVVRDIGQALIVCEATVAAELRDDRIQVEEALNIYNLGRTAWQPDDVRIALPEGFTAFNAQASMSDQAVDEAGGAGKLRGTFAPGRHGVQFRWQLPWSGEENVDFDVGMPPHVAIARVMMPATANIKLAVNDFPAPVQQRDEQGQSFLVTEKRLRPDDARLNSLAIGIHDLPTPGPGRFIATLIAAGSVALGLIFSAGSRSRPRKRGDASRTRQALLAELEDLERAHVAGDVGPKTYERARRELLVSIARTLRVAS
jgi:hypothetical protein